jgi:hypothetical protein
MMSMIFTKKPARSISYINVTCVCVDAGSASNETCKLHQQNYSFNYYSNPWLRGSWMVKGIYESRAKDYANPFRRMVYESQKEMEKVVGRLKDNAFIRNSRTIWRNTRKV